MIIVAFRLVQKENGDVTGFGRKIFRDTQMNLSSEFVQKGPESDDAHAAQADSANRKYATIKMA